mmetsp:Transcript_4273/g.6456  ORF Transcript_4273/g.6456 Transcript_4273/m.6456 type:complete len:161 (-) Transcript_4273:249-731(-)|eukprot:CAMPEP_0118694844 /NCGR_PEP_ID=MMETSP0800-20121206/12795_1 /TAXON_ID=210618 ORGANISM="Striatella unipunctata, Strain CCMP2910" /NCGR_SAMPLE_ID=MMETSP0800 /ASSEMBLY_ACC=CAM_ASM_000638 /LENGTH=160 /DNA_ID=CAMNT_0006593447 /DNA_START=33 /DNA_END=515 /DNA_ORIENTATION=-
MSRPMVMVDTFRLAAEQMRQKAPSLTSNQEVARLYRHALKTLSSWAIDREIFIDEAEKIRARFDENKDAPPATVARLLKEGNDELFEFMHPDPYVVPYMPGGTLFMRNPPLPLEVCFPDGNYPKDAPLHTLNPDMTVSKPDTGKSAIGNVLIDYTKKKME